MTAVSPITRQTVGRTFIAASSALGIGALMQLGVIAWFFMARFHTPPPPAAGPDTAALTPAAPRNFTDPFADAGTAPAGPSPLAATPPPKPGAPQPVTQEALAAATAPAEEPTGQDRFIELVEQARALRERGDTYAAVTKLKEAETFDEHNPIAPAELAMTYEKMGFAEKAAEYWRRIYDMGDAAGIYFAAADGRLKASQAAAQRDASAVVAPAPVATPSPATATAPAEIVGLTAASKLGLLEITRKETAEEGAAKKFVLSVPVKAKARARIDVRDVVVQVLFYETVNERNVERTNAQVSYKWASPPADWSDDDLETLEVTYTLPALRVSDEERKYYGYMVLVYYKNALQDFRSDPPRLAKEMQPPRLLATESSE